MMGWYGDDLASWLAMGAMMLVVWGVLIGLVVWLVHAMRPREEPGVTHTAEQLLAERFARGEIDADEYVHDRELLHGHLSEPAA